MVFVTATVAAAAFLGVSTFALVTTVLSIGYQLHQSNKMKKKQAAAAEARKGFEATKQDQITNLPVVYGRNMLGSVISDYHTQSTYNHATFSGGSNSSGFIKDASNFVRVTVAGDVGGALEVAGNDIVNVISITTEIVFGGLTVNTEQVTSTGRTFRNGVYLTESFQSYRANLPSHTVGGAIYYAGDETRVSDTVYTFQVRKDISNGNHVFSRGLTGSQGGSKNEFLFTQNAICFGGISRVIDVKVDGKRYGHADFNTGIRINTHSDGGADPLASANGFSTSNLFTHTASATCVFKLNRDEPQYAQGIPQVEFFVEGQKVKNINFLGGDNYEMSANYSYSNNPARVLLDYLTNNIYGRGLDAAQIDLESFYVAMGVCDEVVMTDATTPGIINPRNTSNIKRYEINHIVDTTQPIRDNVNQILESMGQATLIWTGGQYKLNLAYPTQQPTVANGQVDSAHVFTDDEIIMSEISMSWPNAQDKFNQITVSFPNAFEEFKTDSVSWPPFSIDPTSPYQIYLTEDSFEELRSNIQPIGITNPYHAQAKAEELVRASRSFHTISLRVSRKALLMEPGDFFIFSSASLDIAEGVYRCESIKIHSDLSVDVEAYFFDHSILAWNIGDNEAYSATQVSDEVVSPIENITIAQTNLDDFDVGRLSWDYSDDTGNGSYTYNVAYKATSDSEYINLTTTRNKTINFQKLEGMATQTSYDFRIFAMTPLGERTSTEFLLSQTINRAPGAIESLNISEEIYVTNIAAGAKSKAILTWSPDLTGIVSHYALIEYKLTYQAAYTTYDTMTGLTADVLDLSPGNYDFRITPFSAHDFAGTPLVIQYTIIGLSDIPSDPTGFVGNVNEGQINLSWNLPTDLDVLYGGSVEIRFHSALTAVASWDTSSVLVNSLSGNTNNKTVPTLKGTFFIKFKDSVGNYSVNDDAFVSTFQDLTFNAVEALDEDAAGFLGNKTNCTVNSGILELDAGQSNMDYEFNNYVDLGEVVTVRVVPNLVASVTNRSFFVEDYTLVSDVTNFEGPTKNANIRVLVSFTLDDPTGTPTWSSYELLTISSIEARGLRFKFVGDAVDTNTAISVTTLEVLIDKKDIIKYGSSTSANNTDTTITFATNFYGGAGGTSSPTIAINVIGGTVGDFAHISARDKNGFSYSVYAAGTSTRVIREIDFQAIGQ